MSIPGTISATALRSNSSDVLGRVHHSQERIVIERNGKPTAALISMADLALLERLEDKLDVFLALEAERAAASKRESPISWNDAKARLGL